MEKNNNLSSIIHILIGLCIMLFGRYLPAPSILVEQSEKLIKMGLPVIDNQVLISITPIGMVVVSIFIGVLYLWTTVETIWPSLLAIFLIGISDYSSMNDVLMRYMGNPTTVMTFFLFMFCAALVQSQVIVYLARWFMTRKFVQGKPWLFIFSLLLAFYITAFLGQMPALFLFLPILYVIFEELKLKRGDKLVSLLIVNCIVMILCSFCSDAINGGAFFLLTNLYNIPVTDAEQVITPINYGTYILFGFTISFIFLLVLMFFMRFIYRVDVSALEKLNPAIFEKDPLPPMKWQQKLIPCLFFFYAAWLLLPSFLDPSSEISIFLKKNLAGGSLLLATALAFIRYKGEKLIHLPLSNKSFPWEVFILISAVFFLGSLLTAPKTNVSLYIEYLMHSLFSGLNVYTFALVLIIIGVIITNFSNSIVVGFIFSPIIVTISNTYGFNPNMLLACFFYIVLFGIVTPAASPFASVLYSNEWISRSTAMYYSCISSFLLVVVMFIIGIPLASILF